MKTTSFIRLATVATAFLFLASSCKKQSDGAVMTEEEAAEAIGLSISGNTNALSSQAAEIAATANAYGAVCGYSKDSSTTRANSAGLYSWNYVFGWQWSTACTGGIPTSMAAGYKMKGTYDAPRMSSNDSAVAAIAVTGLTSGSQYTFNGSYTRDGSQASKIRNQNRFTSKIALTLVNVKVNKVTGQIDGGTASVTISGSTTTGNSFSYGGSIVFNGSRTATITLNNGGVYNISW
jgi:hypothetical protein